MANIIERVTIRGFWGDKTAELKFHQSRNFIIGVNGSGKTTFINLLSASLRMDFETLIKTPFEEISIVLKTIGKNQKPVIKVKKTPLNEYLYQIAYTVQSSSSGRIEFYEFDDFADIAFSRRRRHSPIEEVKHQSLREHLRSLLDLSWLPLWRFHAPGKEVDERTTGSVDAKLEQIKRDFATYFSALQAQAQQETDLLQEKIFLSLITQTDRGVNFTGDPATEQTELEALFREFKMDRHKYRKSILNHFDTVRQAVAKIGSDKGGLTHQEFVALIDNQRIHKLVIEWRGLQNIRKGIYSHRDAFLSIINGLFSRKRVNITDRNQIEIITQSGKTFGLDVLSSGEKQLFVMLGEVLLFEQKPFILIADEPELSLHVDWQSALVRSIQRLNQNVQMIFATHSPDIVGEFESDILRIEDHIS